MARPLRIEFPGAIYHVMSRGNARQAICLDERDYGRLRDDLEDTVLRCGWELFAFTFMPNHFHLFFRTPRPNLSSGMQRLLSTYANQFSRCHHRPGHLFQGRFKGELIEDETYFWTVSRYIHLNPVRGKRPLARHPREWAWSSYSGYGDRRKRLAWIAYDALLEAWRGTSGGTDPAAAYRKYVEQGIEDPPENPLAKAAHGWLLGGGEFVDRIRGLMKSPRFADEVPRSRTLQAIGVETVLQGVAEHYGVEREEFHVRGPGSLARPVAAWLARRLTAATLRELAGEFGLGRPESVSNLTRRIDREIARKPSFRRELALLESQINRTKTKNKV